MFVVKYLVRASNTTVEKVFDSEFLANKLINKLKYSKKCTLISYRKG